MSHSSTSTPPAGTRGAIFEDGTANAIWAAVMTLTVALQHSFLEALREHLACTDVWATNHGARLKRLVSAVREARDLLLAEVAAASDGAVVALAAADDATDGLAGPNSEAGPAAATEPALTEAEYTRLRAQVPQAGWPPASSMRRWVSGSWNDVLREAMVAPVEGGDALLVSRNPSFSWEEVTEAFDTYRAWRAERGFEHPEDFGYWDFINWAKRDTIRALPGRRPRSQSPFNKFGGFLSAKGAWLAGGPAPVGGHPVKAPRAGMSRPASGWGYSPEELKAAVDEVVAHLDGQVPTAQAFKDARRDILAAEELAGLPRRAFPSYNRLVADYKDWDAVLVACGYPPFAPVAVDENGRSTRPYKPKKRITDDDLAAGLLEAFEAEGKPFTSGTYRRYVHNQARKSETGRPLATYPCIYARYRNETEHPWKHACDLFLPEGWDVPDE